MLVAEALGYSEEELKKLDQLPEWAAEMLMEAAMSLPILSPEEYEELAAGQRRPAWITEIYLASPREYWKKPIGCTVTEILYHYYRKDYDEKVGKVLAGISKPDGRVTYWSREEDYSTEEDYFVAQYSFYLSFESNGELYRCDGRLFKYADGSCEFLRRLEHFRQKSEFHYRVAAIGKDRCVMIEWCFYAGENDNKTKTTVLCIAEEV